MRLRVPTFEEVTTTDCLTCGEATDWILEETAHREGHPPMKVETSYCGKHTQNLCSLTMPKRRAELVECFLDHRATCDCGENLTEKLLAYHVRVDSRELCVDLCFACAYKAAASIEEIPDLLIGAVDDLCQPEENLHV